MSEQRGKAAGTAEVLLALAQRFDTMMPSWTLIIAASPEQWGPYREVIKRIVRASNGRLQLQLVESLSLPSAYPAEPIPATEPLWNFAGATQNSSGW